MAPLFPPRRTQAIAWGPIAVLALIFAVPTHAAAPDSSHTPTLAGVWTLDVGKSDSAEEKLAAMRRSGAGWQRTTRVGREGGGIPGERSRGGPGGGVDERRERPNDPERRLMMRPPASMLIEQTDSTVVLFEQGLPIEVLVIGLPQDRAGTVEPGAPHVVATWSTGRLLTLREDDRGGRAVQQFALSPDGKTLSLILRREPRDDRPVLEIRREYRRDDG